jgi:hypothetical protein
LFSKTIFGPPVDPPSCPATSAIFAVSATFQVISLQTTNNFS